MGHKFFSGFYAVIVAAMVSVMGCVGFTGNSDVSPDGPAAVAFDGSPASPAPMIAILDTSPVAASAPAASHAGTTRPANSQAQAATAKQGGNLSVVDAAGNVVGVITSVSGAIAAVAPPGTGVKEVAGIVSMIGLAIGSILHGLAAKKSS